MLVLIASVEMILSVVNGDLHKATVLMCKIHLDLDFGDVIEGFINEMCPGEYSRWILGPAKTLSL